MPVTRVFIICPVRNVSEEVKMLLKKYVASLEGKWYSIHWPQRDTNQDDAVGLAICEQNRAAIRSADEIHVWLDPQSQGSIFDLGMAFAFMLGMKKKIVLINELEPTAGKSFQNVLLALSGGLWRDK